ncbi:hypothetical protein KAI87_01115 [Myxococcota bacterium]|nr:hypothetical protein [Myxococcota bacterium]
MQVKRYMRRALLALASGSTSVILAACYGAPVDYDYDRQVIINTTTESGQPIEGLQVQIDCATGGTDSALTDYSGEAYVYVPEGTDLASCSVTVTDIDGPENGGEFTEETLTLNDWDESYDVEMSE